MHAHISIPIPTDAFSYDIPVVHTPAYRIGVFQRHHHRENDRSYAGTPPPAWATPYYCHDAGGNSSGSVHMRGQSCQAIILSSNQQITSSPCCRIRSHEFLLQIYLPRHHFSESIYGRKLNAMRLTWGSWSYSRAVTLDKELSRLTRP